MTRRPPRSPHLVEVSAASGQVGVEPGPIDMAGFTRRLYGQALRILKEIETEHETMTIDNQCKLLSTLGVLAKNLIFVVKGTPAVPQSARRAPAYAAGDDGGDDDGIDLGDDT